MTANTKALQPSTVPNGAGPQPELHRQPPEEGERVSEKRNSVEVAIGLLASLFAFLRSALLAHLVSPTFRITPLLQLRQCNCGLQCTQ
eukprot:3956683-Amphidinium_carterae.1